MIDLKSLYVKAQDKEILSDLNFLIKKSDFVSVLGKNGAGKTSLFKAIFSLIKYEGSLKVEGKESSSCSGKELAKLVSFIPQEMPVIPSFSVKDVVLMSRLPYKESSIFSSFGAFSKKDKEIAEASLERASLKEFINRDFGSLSGGEKKKVLIASALSQQTPALLLDEPGSFLDPLALEELYSLLLDLNQNENKTIIIASHEINYSSAYSKRIIGLASGKQVFDGSPQDFMKQDVLNKIYGSSFFLEKHPTKNINMIFPGGRENES